MKCYISVVCVLSAFVAVTLAAPATLEDTGLVAVHNQVKRQTDDNQQEALNRVVNYVNQKLMQLRRICPQPFQVIDMVIQNLTSQVFRVVGGALLRTNLGGGSSSGGSSGGGGRVSVVLPTSPPDEDDEDEDDDDEEEEEDVDLRTRVQGSSGNSSSSTASSSVVALSAGELTSTENNEIDDGSKTTAKSVETSTSTGSSNAPFTSPSLDNPAKRHIRRPREAEAQEDQDAAASGGNGPDPNSDLSNVETDDADRNKRFLPFGDPHAAGGSGNFLFDLIRNTADRAARTVGTVYRMVAGTENLGFGITATASSSKTLAPGSQLVAGSGATEEHDEKTVGVGGVAEVDIAPKSHEGIPGPITRLLVIANRGIANLIQDLILRLAQTSERIVNFKARLVTALI